VPIGSVVTTIEVRISMALVVTDAKLSSDDLRLARQRVSKKARKQERRT
jgi:hypothetical protein